MDKYYRWFSSRRKYMSVCPYASFPSINLKEERKGNVNSKNLFSLSEKNKLCILYNIIEILFWVEENWSLVFKKVTRQGFVYEGNHLKQLRWNPWFSCSYNHHLGRVGKMLPWWDPVKVHRMGLSFCSPPRSLCFVYCRCQARDSRSWSKEAVQEVCSSGRKTSDDRRIKVTSRCFAKETKRDQHITC